MFNSEFRPEVSWKDMKQLWPFYLMIVGFFIFLYFLISHFYDEVDPKEYFELKKKQIGYSAIVIKKVNRNHSYCVKAKDVLSDEVYTICNYEYYSENGFAIGELPEIGDRIIKVENSDTLILFSGNELKKYYFKYDLTQSGFYLKSSERKR